MYLAFLYLGSMLAIILIWFLLLKRPIYESILISFLVLLSISGKWASVWTYIYSGLSTSLLYSMTVFVAMSVILTKTKVIDGAIEIVLALLGRVTGGAGYVAVVASSFMGALSGSGPGNVMATGSITIPAMKKSGFSDELAANITSSASCLGNMIPPSSTIVAALGIIQGLYPDKNISTGQFWIVCWGCSVWFILLRLIMVFIFCKKTNVKPMAEKDIPKISTVLKTGWRGLLLPILILIPFVLDYFFKDTFYSVRLGTDGAANLSNSLLYFIAGLATIYGLFVAEDKSQIKFSKLARMLSDDIKSIVPTIAICLFGYMFGALFNDLDVAAGVETGIAALHLSKLGLCMLIPLITCILGIAVVGSSMVVIFGSIFIAMFAAVGVEPLLIAAMLPCICGVMSNMVPPIAPAFLAGVSLAEADFSKAVKNDLWWIVTQYILEIVVLMGWLPIIGM